MSDAEILNAAVAVVRDRECLGLHGSGEALLAHESFDRAAGDANVLSVQLGLDPVRAMDEQALVVDALDLHQQFRVGQRTP